MDAVWIKTDPDEHGDYHVVLEIGPDDVIPLDAVAAYQWARSVLSAVAQAEYDAAVLEQMAAQPEVAGDLIVKMRKRREDSVPLSAIPGLALVPGVSHITRKGFLRLDRHGKPIGQWEMDDARQHALAVIEAFEVSVLDTVYLRTLEEIGIPTEMARGAVGNLAQHR